MTDGENIDDPGWRGLKSVIASMYPGGMKRMQHRSLLLGDTPLVMIRKVHMRFLVTQVIIALIALLLAGLGDLQGSSSKALVVGGVIAVGLLTTRLARSLDKPFDCSEPLLAQYQTRFFKRIAFASVPEIAGFAGLILTGDLFPFLLGAAFAIMGHLYAAPSQTNLDRDQAALDEVGCTRSVFDEVHADFVDATLSSED